MSVGSTGKWFALGLLVASLGATGCKDDNNDEDEVDSGKADAGVKDAGKDEEDAGKTDAGKDGGGASDAGSDAAPPVMCGGKACSSHTAGGMTFAAGCALNAADAEVCGISTAAIFPADSGGPAFLEKGAPGIASTTCGAFLDKLDTLQDGGVAGADAITKNNNKLDRYIQFGGMPLQLSTPGCCTPLGYCSGDTDNGTAVLDPDAGTGLPSVGGFGCMKSVWFLQTAPAPYRMVPCDADSGVIKPPADAGATDAGAGDGGASDASNDAAGG